MGTLSAVPKSHAGVALRPRSSQKGETGMMDGFGMGFGMGIGWLWGILLLVLVGLAIAALIKYLRK